ncbi:MAG: glycosyltransferase family 4 protein [Candidatus Eremiobacteraeota bacterium]|nr:glycosyltransferase family 4 protein [Candidatus Eremiobacteraeota bacterium]
MPRWLPGNHLFHVTNVLLAPAFVPYLPLLRGRLVAWTHALEMTHPKLQVPISLLLRGAVRVVTVSEYSRGLALERGARAERTLTISAGGDDLYRRFENPSRTAFRARLGIASDEFAILTTGRLSSINRYKGYDRAIQVAELLMKRRRRFRWVVIGGGDDLEFYRTNVTRTGLGTYMQFASEASDEQLAEAYAGCDLFALLSREEKTEKGIMAEGYGIVYVEANSYGKPALGLRYGGVPDAIIHERTGVLVDRDDATLIADAIERLIVDDSARARYGEEGRRRALAEASWGAARQRMRDLIADISSHG